MSAVPPPTPAAVKALVALLAFLGLSGLLGGAAFVAAPDGHLIQAPPEWLERIPFPDFLVPGLVLLSAVGVLPLLAAGALLWLPARPALRPLSLRGRHWAWTAAGLAGVAIVVFELVELAMIPFGWLHAVYLGLGAAILLLAASRPVREHCRSRLPD